MICPGCKKENFYEISVCVTCGTMINDSVREELIVKITPLKLKPAPIINMNRNPAVQKKEVPERVKEPTKFVLTQPKHTSEISSPKTSPTLVEFQNKNAKIPEWRLQLQNAVRQRYKNEEVNTHPTSTNKSQIQSPELAFSSNGNTALKVSVETESVSEKKDNSHLRKALERIERSRRTFLREDPEEIAQTQTEADFSAQISPGHQLRIATLDDKPVPISDELKTLNNLPPKPKLVPKKAKTTTNLYDTSELDPEFIPAKVSSSFEKSRGKKTETETKVTPEKEEFSQDETEDQMIEEQVFDDYAPFALRFNAGLFDLIIGSFISLILLSPFMLLGGNWFTITGFFAFLATCSLVMFIYQTTTIGMFGKTFGMHLFSLEMIDLNGEDYPTFHQAAVSSSIYLLSVSFCGLGFVTSVFDEEKRTIHDIVSGTLVVREI
jgi:uncharacterized RDD family membrane protein YckC